MSDSKQPMCPECGKPVPKDSQHQVCPACLMEQALASRTIVGGNPSTAAPPPAPEEIAGKFPAFEILECLGRGGMGVVYKARQKSLHRLVAIKILPPERVGEEKFSERFATEAATLAKLSHTNIVTVHDFGETGGLFYIVMEYVDGVNLRDLLREGRMEPEQALAIVPPICEALEYAHDKGVVHRDIKPENILLDREGRVKIADFGIASLVGATGEKSGTPPYMAPEQSGGTVDRRTDIYALGAVLYEMLTGERPAKDLVAPSKRVQIDGRIDEMVLRALEKEPERRYQTAGEFLTVVETMASTPFVGGGRNEPAVVEQSELDVMSADRSNWRLWVFYFCRRDPRVVVPKRIHGFGWTINFANPWSIPFMAALILGVLGAVKVASLLGRTSTQDMGLLVAALIIAIIWICHRMSRGPRSREVTVSPLTRTLITATIGLGLMALFGEEGLPHQGKIKGRGSVTRLVQEGWSLWSAGDPVKAKSKFAEAVERDSGNADAWNGLGWSSFNSGDAATAERAFRKVLEIDPDHPAALNGMGQVALSRGEFEQAEDFLLKAAEENATAAWFGLARLYLLQGKFDQAEKWAQMLVDAGQADEEAKKMLDAAVGRKLPDALKAMLEPVARPSGE